MCMYLDYLLFLLYLMLIINNNYPINIFRYQNLNNKVWISNFFYYINYCVCFKVILCLP